MKERDNIKSKCFIHWKILFLEKSVELELDLYHTMKNISKIFKYY